MVGCNRIFEGMNHRLLGCTLQRNDPSATWSQLLLWCAWWDDPGEALWAGWASALPARCRPLPQHPFQGMMILSFPLGLPAMAGWSACGAHNSFVHPCPCLSLPGESCFLGWGWSQWRCVGTQEAAAAFVPCREGVLLQQHLILGLC